MSKMPEVFINIGKLIKRKVQEAHTDKKLVDIDKKLTEIKWDKLKIKEKNDSISMDESWRLISRVLGKQLFGTQMCVVPNIGDVKYFDLLYCFVKKGGIKDMLKPVYTIAGPLQDLAQKTEEMGNNVEQLSKFLKSESYKNYTEPYTLFWSNGEKDEKLKSIRVTLTNFSTFVVPWNLFLESNISLAVDPGREELSGKKSIYVIDEVVYVEKIQIEVTIGEKQADMNIPGNTPKGIPLAFHYEKFSLDQNGFVGDNNPDSGVNPLAKFVNIH